MTDASPELPTPQSIEVVLPCNDLAPTLAFFQGRLGFRVDAIYPADEPRIANLSRPGLSVRLEPGDHDPGLLRLVCADGDGREVKAPNGTRIRLDPPRLVLERPPFVPRFAVVRTLNDAQPRAGRAGMIYQDLLPSKEGRYVASLISIPDGGPVSDWIHHHAIDFQLIFCRRGWVKVVYEGQGEPFVLNEGDLVLQPPGIRHRVLEASPGLEVIEISSPSLHETFADPVMALPTPEAQPQRLWEGQGFLRSRADAAVFEPLPSGGFETRATGLDAASCGRADVRIHRLKADTGPDGALPASAAELRLLCLLHGAATLIRGGERVSLASADAVLAPPGEDLQFTDMTRDFVLFEVTAPA